MTRLSIQEQSEWSLYMSVILHNFIPESGLILALYVELGQARMIDNN